MHELITRLTEKTGISTDQAINVLNTVKEFVKEKFPMMAGAVDNLFASEAEDLATATTAAGAATTAGETTAVPDPAAPHVPGPSVLDKISDVIPGQAGQKVEDFVKGAAHKAGDAFDSVKEKLGGMFGNEKGNG